MLIGRIGWNNTNIDKNGFYWPFEGFFDAAIVWNTLVQIAQRINFGTNEVPLFLSIASVKKYEVNNSAFRAA
jgi:hypothetical protein